MKTLTLFVLTSLALAAIAAEANASTHDLDSRPPVACRLYTTGEAGGLYTRFTVTELPDDRNQEYSHEIRFERAPGFMGTRGYFVHELSLPFGGNYPRMRATGMAKLRPRDNDTLELVNTIRKQMRVHAEGTIQVGDRMPDGQFGKFRFYLFECDERLPIRR
jgi:hypothetical protein